MTYSRRIRDLPHHIDCNFSQARAIRRDVELTVTKRLFVCFASNDSTHEIRIQDAAIGVELVNRGSDKDNIFVYIVRCIHTYSGGLRLGGR